MILQPQVVALGLLLLQTGAVFPNQVNTMVDESVTLPCSYSVRNKTVLPMCWGRGPCPSCKCSNTLIKMDEHRMTYQKDSCYWLQGKIRQGDVSFTIENVTVGDSSQYCSHNEVLEWFTLIRKTAHLSVMSDKLVLPLILLVRLIVVWVNFSFSNMERGPHSPVGQ